MFSDLTFANFTRVLIVKNEPRQFPNLCHTVTHFHTRALYDSHEKFKEILLSELTAKTMNLNKMTRQKFN